MFDRKKIGEIICLDNGENWWKPDLFFRHTLPVLPNELEVVLTPPDYEDNYNCFIYILGLHEDKEVIKDCKGFIYNSFIKNLISLGVIKKKDIPAIGDYLFYENSSGELTHGAVFEKENTLVSKWSWGPLLRHKTWEVPDFYGDKVFYTNQVDKEKAKELYWKYRDKNTIKGI